MVMEVLVVVGFGGHGGEGVGNGDGGGDGGGWR